MNGIEPALARSHSYWKEKRSSRPAGIFNDLHHHRGQKEIAPIVGGDPKIDRNDPCPCGSGKKFKNLQAPAVALEMILALKQICNHPALAALHGPR